MADGAPGPGLARLIVVVPAHDEAALLPGSLASIEVAIGRVEQLGVDCSVVVVADGCSDETASVARDLLRRPADAVVVCRHRCVGLARRRGSAVALRGRHPGRVWLANTDADTEVPPTWLVDQLAFARAGVRAVAGTVELGPVLPALSSRFARTYVVDSDGSHAHVHGANLGVRGDVYLEAGGWAALCTREDHDLWQRIRSTGPVLSTSSLRVRTSSRLVGRAPRGFADGLAELAASS